MYWHFLQVTFEGVVGLDAFSDIAIDDVDFQENTACAKTAETLGKDLIIQIQNEASILKKKSIRQYNNELWLTYVGA